MVIYDNASWHFGSDFPKNLPQQNSASHTGMFFFWCVENNMISSDLKKNASTSLEKLKQKQITGAEFIFDELKGVFSELHLTEMGNSFAKDYYVDDTDFGEEYSSFANDYIHLFDLKAEQMGFEYETFYHIENSFENYNLMKQMIQHRFDEWKIYRNLN